MRLIQLNLTNEVKLIIMLRPTLKFKFLSYSAIWYVIQSMELSLCSGYVRHMPHKFEIVNNTKVRVTVDVEIPDGSQIHCNNDNTSLSNDTNSYSNVSNDRGPGNVVLLAPTGYRNCPCQSGLFRSDYDKNCENCHCRRGLWNRLVHQRCKQCNPGFGMLPFASSIGHSDLLNMPLRSHIPIRYNTRCYQNYFD